MKTMRVALLLLTLAASAGVSAQTITGYGVIKTHFVNQTTGGAPVDDSHSPYGISAYVFGTGLTGPYTFTSASGSAVSGQTLTNDSTKADFQSDATSYANIT